MITQVIVELDNVAGAQLRVMNCLKTLGLRCVKHALKSLPTGQKLLALEADGVEVDEDHIRGQLVEVKGVKSVAKVARVGNQEDAAGGAAAEPEEPRELTEAEKRFKSKDSEAGDAEMRDRMLVFSLLSRYPSLTARLMELRGSIPEEEQLPRMHELGVGFGSQLFKNLKVKEPVTNTIVAIDKVIIPAIKPLVQLNSIGNSLEVLDYTKNMVKKTKMPHHCQFLLGTMEGLLLATPDLPAHTIKKTRCIHTGDDACEYVFESS